MSITVAVFLAVGLLFVGISLPLIRRRVPPNQIYGLRVPATFADEWVWYEANARSGRDFFALGIVVMVVAVVLPFVVRIGESAYTLAMAGVLLVGTLASAVRGWRTANRLLEERRRDGGGSAEA
jgi:uncharacterized membrane protein